MKNLNKVQVHILNEVDSKGKEIYHVFGLCRCCGKAYGLVETKTVRATKSTRIEFIFACFGKNIIQKCKEECHKRCETLENYRKRNEEEANYIEEYIFHKINEGYEIFIEINLENLTSELFFKRLLEWIMQKNPVYNCEVNFHYNNIGIIIKKEKVDPKKLEKTSAFIQLLYADFNQFIIEHRKIIYH